MPSQATRPPLVGMPAVWLRDNCPCPLCRDPVSGQRLLHITDIAADIAVAEVVPSAGTVSVPFHPDGHRAVFDPSDVPTAPGAVLEVAASLGYVRETNYGRLFDVRVESSPSNLAFTSLPIPPHTDNPYRDPVPTVQLLHCLHDAAEGGEAARVDPDLPDPPRASRLISGRVADSSVAVGERATTGVIRRKDRI